MSQERLCTRVSYVEAVDSSEHAISGSTVQTEQFKQLRSVAAIRRYLIVQVSFRKSSTNSRAHLQTETRKDTASATHCSTLRHTPTHSNIVCGQNPEKRRHSVFWPIKKVLSHLDPFPTKIKLQISLPRKESFQRALLRFASGSLADASEVHVYTNTYQVRTCQELAS